MSLFQAYIEFHGIRPENKFPEVKKNAKLLLQKVVLQILVSHHSQNLDF